MSVEAKVGAFTIGGLLLFIVSFIGLEGIHLGSNDGYTIYAGFHQSMGLVEQTNVCLSGVPVGRVERVYNDGGGVTVEMRLNPEVKIPRKSAISITSSGVMGEKFVNIIPHGNGDDCLVDGEYVYGADDSGMDSMFQSMNKTLEKAQELLISINDIIADPTLKQSLIEMSVSMKNASAHMDGLMASLERMAVGNEANVNQAMSELPVIMASMERTMGSVEHMMANIDTVAGDPQVAENLRLTLQNVADTSKRVEHMVSNMDTVLGDPKTAEDAKAIISNARSLTERADKMLGAVSSIEVKPSVDVLYSGGAHDWDTNFNLDVGAPKKAYLRLGVDDIGDDNLFNAQVGKRFGNFGARAGVVAGKPGVGVDAYAGDRWTFSADAYNMNDATLRLRATYRVAGGTHLMGQWNDVNHKDKRRAYVGIRQEF